jgi:D-alanyl-D-alanine-carboxypeptidase/D-alanyl-D-alanine-endopeptidase
MLESHRPLRLCRPPPELIGQRDIKFQWKDGPTLNTLRFRTMTFLAIKNLLFRFVFLLSLLQVETNTSTAVESSSKASSLTEAEIKVMLQDYIDTDKLGVGIAVGIVDTNGPRVIGHGKLDNGTGREVDGDTVFEIGSITKVFTALLLQDMIERGEMKLDDPVQKFLPDSVKVPTYQGRQITLLHLATHTSGLPRMPNNLSPRSWRDPDQADYTVEQLYAFLSRHRLRRVPGSEAVYSNLGMLLLGHVIVQKAGKDYEALIIERICQPLRMNSTRIALTPELESRLATGHAMPGRPVSRMNFRFLPGAGGLHSSANDLLKFVSAYLGLNPTPLNSLMEKARAFHPIESGTKLMLAWGGDDTAFGHNGGTYGYMTIIGFDPKQRRGFTVLSNCRNSGIVDAMREPLRAAPSPRPASAVPVDPARYDAYVGQYKLDDTWNTCTIRREKDRLLVQWIDQSGGRSLSYEMFPQSESVFRNEFWGVESTFSCATNGPSVELILRGLAPCSGIKEPLKLTRVSRDVPEAVPAPIQLQPEIYERYIGQYRKTFLFGLIRLGPTLSISHELDELGNHFVASVEGVPSYSTAEFFPVTENCFIVNPITTGDKIRLTFLRNRKGKATRVGVYWDGKKLRGTRVSDQPAQ